MDILLTFKLILLLRLCPLLHIANADYYGQYYELPNYEDSESQENQNPPIQQQMPMTQMESMSMPIQMPMQMPQPSSHSIPQMPMSMPQVGMHQMPQMSMPSMSVPQMSSMSMPQMSMQMFPMHMPMHMQPSPFAAPFSGQFPSSNMIYFPLTSQLRNFVKNITMLPSSYLTTLPNVNTIASTSTPQTTTTTQGTTTTQLTTTTQATTTTQVTTTTSTTRPPTQPAITTTVQEYRRNGQLPDIFLKSQRDQQTILASLLRNAINVYSKNIMKKQERLNYDKKSYSQTPMRKSNSAWIQRYGIVPRVDNIAKSFMTPMRSVKGIRPRPTKSTVPEYGRPLNY